MAIIIKKIFLFTNFFPTDKRQSIQDLLYFWIIIQPGFETAQQDRGIGMGVALFQPINHPLGLFMKGDKAGIFRVTPYLDPLALHGRADSKYFYM